MRRDASVAAFDHTDGQRDEFLGGAAERTIGERCLVELREPLVHIRDVVAQFATERAKVVEDLLAVLMITHGVLLVSEE